MQLPAQFTCVTVTIFYRQFFLTDRILSSLSGSNLKPSSKLFRNIYQAGIFSSQIPETQTTKNEKNNFLLLPFL
jgi:hypothetical protein